MWRHAQNTGTAWALVGTVVAGLLVAGPALAQQADRQRPSLLTLADPAAMAQIFWHRVQARVGLTDQQVRDIRTLLEEQRATARTTMYSLMVARQDIGPT